MHTTVPREPHMCASLATDTPMQGRAVSWLTLAVASLVGLALTPVRGLPRMLAHAALGRRPADYQARSFIRHH